MKDDLYKYLTNEELLKSYDVVNGLYGNIFPLVLWRIWEHAAYSRYNLEEPILDVGCGDGRFFRSIWPEIKNVVGIDMDEAVANNAKHSGVYKEILVQAADEEINYNGHFSTVFANCSMEHMDNLDKVLDNVSKAIKDDGTFIFSIVTDRYLEWNSLINYVSEYIDGEKGAELEKEYLDYHHLVNPLKIEEWACVVEKHDFSVTEILPIIPEVMGKVFLLFDTAWHQSNGEKELGFDIEMFFNKFPNSAKGFKKIFEGLLDIDDNKSSTCGAIFIAKRRS